MDSFTTKEGNHVVKMIAQSMYVLSSNEAEERLEEAEQVNSDEVPEDTSIGDEDEENNLDITDDDLPF